MRDLLERRLATRFRQIGETVSDDVVVPVGLELRVQREQRRAARARRWPAVAVAALIVGVFGSLAVLRGTSGRGSVRVGVSSSIPLPVHDALQPGSVMLSAYGHYVISLDAHGRRNATMVTGRGEINYARATDSHHTIWYLSHRVATSRCGEVVRADIDGRSSTVVARAVAFDVSRDGSRLALYGAGDLAHGGCVPARAPGTGRVVIIDLATRRSSAVALDDVTSLRWSLDGSSVVAVRCAAGGCGADRIAAPAELGERLHAMHLPALASPAGVTVRVEFGVGGLYALRASSDAASGSSEQTIDLYDPAGRVSASTLFDGSGHWVLRQMVPTATGMYVLATPGRRAGAGSNLDAGAALYRLEAGRLVWLRPTSGPMTLTAVSPLSSS